MTWAESAQQYLSSNQAKTCISVFDYGAASTQWVTDPAISGALATTINALAARSRNSGGIGKVIVVAHSMGGLATRCAISATCSKVQGAAQNVEDLITFGSPTLGAWLKGGTASDAEHLLGDLASGACYADAQTSFLAGFCEQERALGTSAAAAAFTPGSAQLSVLGEINMPFPVLALAGSLKVGTSLFGHTFFSGDVGDGVVSEDSALADAQSIGGLGGKAVVDCGVSDLSTWTSSDKMCWHGTETSDPTFLADALHEITEAEDRQAPASASPSGPGCPATAELTGILTTDDPALVGNSVATLHNPICIDGWTMGYLLSGGIEYGLASFTVRDGRWHVAMTGDPTAVCRSVPIAGVAAPYCQ